MVLCAPILLSMIPMLMTGSRDFDGDVAFYFYPMIRAGMSQWMHGCAPLWTHLIQCGFPLLADGQAALCYPPHLLANLMLPTALAEHCCIASQVVLTALFMYFFLTDIGIAPWPAVAGGWIWVFSGPIPSSIGSPALNGLTWWPLWFLFAGRLASSIDWRIIALTGLAMGLGWLGGFPQTTFYGIFAASTYLILLLLSRHRFRSAAWIPALAGWAVAAGLGIGIASMQLLPTFEMSRFSVRSGGIDYAFAAMGSMPPTGLVSLLLPDWVQHLFAYGLTGVNIFMGFIPLAMLTLCFKKGMRRRTLFFIGLSIAGCLLAAGKYDPLYKIVYAVPGFNFFHNPSRFLYWSYFGFAVLGAEGFNRFHDAKDGAAVEIRRLCIRLGAIVGATLGICLGGELLYRGAKNTIAQIALRQAQAQLARHAYKMQNIDYYSAKITRMLADIAAALDPGNGNFLIAVLIALIAIATLAIGLRAPRLHARIRFFLIALSLLNITQFWNLLHFHPQRNAMSPPRLAEYYSRQGGLFRIYNMQSSEDIAQDGAFSFSRLDADNNMLYAIDQVGEYAALGSYRYFRLLGSLGSVNLAFGMPPVTEQDVRIGLPVLSLCNVRYVSSTTPLAIPGLTREPFDSLFLYRNDAVMPRAFVVPTAIVIPDPARLLDSLHSSRFNPRAAVFLESTPPVSTASGIQSTPAIRSYADNNVAMDADGPGWLVLTDLYYPGWKARIDGQETPLYRGDYVFRTLPLKAGRHTVEFFYESVSFRNGAILSALFLFLTAGILVIGVLMAGRRNIGICS
jgi:hypothetical protein